MDNNNSINTLCSNVFSLQSVGNFKHKENNVYFSYNDNLIKESIYNDLWAESIPLIQIQTTQDHDLCLIEPFKKEETSSSENQKNTERLSTFVEQTPIFLTILKDSEFEDGYENPAIRYFQDMLNTNYAAAFIWLNNLYINNVNNDEIIEKILRIFSFIDYDENTMASFPIIAANAIEIGSDKVKEAAIMAFESWRTPACLNLLKKLEVKKEWLNLYLQKVIQELEEEISLC